MTQPRNYRPWNMKSVTRKPREIPSKQNKKVIYGTLSLCRTSFLHLLKSPLFQQQHHAPLCTGVRGWIEVNTPLESSTQYLLPWPNKWRVSEGASRVDGWGLVIGVWRVGRRVDISVSGGCLASGSRWGGSQTAGTHGWLSAGQRPGPVPSNTLSCRSVYLSPFLSLCRGQGASWPWMWIETI